MNDADLIYQQWRDEDGYERRLRAGAIQKIETGNVNINSSDISINLLGTLISNVLQQNLPPSMKCNKIEKLLKQYNLYYEPKQKL